MALTDKSHIYARFHESAFNNLIQTFMEQRPATFNYATQSIIDDNSACSEIRVHPDLENEQSLQKWTVLDPISLPLTNEQVHYLVQLADFKFDFAPNNIINIPNELGGTLEAQEIGFVAKLCGGVACGEVFSREDVKEMEKKIKGLDLRKYDGLKKVLGLKKMNLHCFCLEVFVTVIIERDPTHLSLKVTGIEIQDIEPEGVENALECFILKILDYSVLPQLRIEIGKLAFGVGDYFNIGLANTSPLIPFNPSVTNDNLEFFININ